MSGHSSHVIVGRDREVTIIAFSRADVIDTTYIHRVAAEMRDIVNTVEPPLVVIDFERVRYLSSAALGVLVEISETLQERGGRLVIANVAEEVYGVFRLTKLPKIIDIAKSTDAAVKSLA